MRIAVILYGEARFIEETARSIREEFDFDGCVTDYFYHSWNHIGYNMSQQISKSFDTQDQKQIQEKYERLYQPKGGFVSSSDELRDGISSFESFKKFLRKDINKGLNEGQIQPANIDIHNYYTGQFYSLGQAIKAKQKYEKENNFKYDLVIKTRTDRFYRNKSLYSSEEEYHKSKHDYYIKTLNDFERKENEKVIFSEWIIFSNGVRGYHGGIKGIPEGYEQAKVAYELTSLRFIEDEYNLEIKNTRVGGGKLPFWANSRRADGLADSEDKREGGKNESSKWDTRGIFSLKVSERSSLKFRSFGAFDMVQTTGIASFGNSESADAAWNNLASLYFLHNLQHIKMIGQEENIPQLKHAEIIEGQTFIDNKVSLCRVNKPSRQFKVIQKTDKSKKGPRSVFVSTYEDMTEQVILNEKLKHEKKKYVFLHETMKYGGGNHGKNAHPLLKELGAKSIIDIGCGRSEFRFTCRENGIEAIGADIAYKEADIVCPASDIPVDDCSFDYVTSFDVLEHLLPEEVDATLEEMRRVAKKGFIFTICYNKSSQCVKEVDGTLEYSIEKDDENKPQGNLHQTVKPRAWWAQKLSKFGSVCSYKHGKDEYPYEYLYIKEFSDNKKPDLLLMQKYLERGAYHWKKYGNNERFNKDCHAILDYFVSIENNYGQNIVDIGCGDALWVHLLKKEGYSICGFDANELAVKLAKEQGVADISHHYLLDYNKKHDVAILFDSFEHFEEPEKHVEKLTEIISDRIYILNPLWESPDFHFDFYDTPKLVALFENSWKLTHEHVFENRRSLMQFTKKNLGKQDESN